MKKIKKEKDEDEEKNDEDEESDEDSDDAPNHYVCLAKYQEEDGYFIYDDLLNLQPGSFQGGFVPKNQECYNQNLEFFSQHVPIFIYKRIENNNKVDTKNEENEDGKQKEDITRRRSARLIKNRLNSLIN